MRTKQLFLTLALLCAMVQTSWAQASWDEVYAMTNTTETNWTALPEGTTAMMLNWRNNSAFICIAVIIVTNINFRVQRYK